MFEIKAIILAAGMGKRLGKYTKESPKCMLKFNELSLLQRQINIMKRCGITKIIVVKGFKGDQIKIPEVKYYVNNNYNTTNMVETLFTAEEELNDDLIVCYGDIIYQKSLLEKIIAAKVDIGVSVDADYLEYWGARLENLQDDTESLVIKDNLITEIGEPNCSKDKAKVRYIGLIKFSKVGTIILKRVYHLNKIKNYDSSKPWMRSSSFRNAYMTCLLQAIINSGDKVKPIITKRGWLEFDTFEDVEKYEQWLNDGSLARFINLNL